MNTPCTDWAPRALVESDSTIRRKSTLYPPEDDHLWLETCRGIIFYKQKVTLCLQANAQMVPKCPSCYYMLLM